MSKGARTPKKQRILEKSEDIAERVAATMNHIHEDEFVPKILVIEAANWWQAQAENERQARIAHLSWIVKAAIEYMQMEYGARRLQVPQATVRREVMSIHRASKRVVLGEVL